MSVRFHDECRYKEELVNHLSSAVKQVQMEFMSQKGDEESRAGITNSSPAGRILFSSLEMILCHGLKRQDLGIWQAVQYFSRNDVKRTINNLINVRTNKGKSRAWIYLTLNEKELESYIHSFQTNFDHFDKFYARSALIFSNQVSLLQTLISGLDGVVFCLELDVSYLDYSIMCGKNWTKDQSISNRNITIATSADKGSIVHIDTKSISEAGQKAVGLIKGLVSQETSSSSKSMRNIDSETLVAVTSNQGHMRGKKYCPDCGNPNELICLCISKKQQPPPIVPSKNAEILRSVLESGENISDRNGIFEGRRVNPFDTAYMDVEEIEMAKIKKLDFQVLMTDTPLEVKRIPRKRRKRRSNTSSVCSTKSEELVPSGSCFMEFRKAAEKSNFHCDFTLSNPLVGFDPGNEEFSNSGSEFSLLNVDGAHDESIVFIEQEIEADRKSSTSTDFYNDNELTPDKINALNTECLMSSQKPSVDIPNVEILSEAVEFEDFVHPHSASNTMDLCSEQVETLDNNENVSGDKYEHGVEQKSARADEGVEEKPADVPLLADMSHDDIVDNEIFGEIRKRRGSNESHTSSIDSETRLRPSTPEDSFTHCNITMSTQSTPIKRVANDLTTSSQSDCDENVANLTDDVTLEGDSLKYEKDARLMTAKEKQDVRKMKSSMRYRSHSEKLLEDLTKREVERLRAEVEARLKPSRDKLEKVQKYILQRTESSDVDSSLSEKDDPPSTSAKTSNDLNSDYAAILKEIIPPSTSTTENAPTTAADTPDSSVRSDVPIKFKAVAKVDNTLRLYLMLEILVNENEEIMKMFHLSTGHSEGNWVALYLLFSDSCLYFLRSGDGNSPYQPEHIVPYEDMDYASVGSHDQTIEFVFYKTRKSKTKKQPSKFRAKVLVDSGDADLTTLIISTLSDSVALHTRRHSMIKVCPPVFRDAREHEISLVKYLRSEGLTGDIQYYQLVHWEDPDFVKGASVTKVSMQGTLRYKVHSFWGSSTKSSYFVLSGGILHQYADRDSQKPDGIYELTNGKCVGCRRVKLADSTNAAGLDFIIDFQDNTRLELSGFSMMEVTEWLQCLCMIVSLDQAVMVDQQACTDGIVMNMLNHDALVPCSLIVADETMLLCHEDHHTGFCRTLATAKREEIRTVNIDRTGSIMCELLVQKDSTMPQAVKWGIFFPRRDPLQVFINVIDSFSKPPSLCEKDGASDLTHYLEARALLDSRWTRTDNLLKGRSAGSESYAFI